VLLFCTPARRCGARQRARPHGPGQSAHGRGALRRLSRPGCDPIRARRRHLRHGRRLPVR